MKVFVSGSRSVSELSVDVKCVLDRLVELGAEVLVGDCYGADAAVQAYLKGVGYERVVVYHVGVCRHNVGFEAVKVAGGYVDKDIEMSKLCDYGLVVWDGTSKGTLNNIRRLKKMGKKVKILKGGAR